MDITINTIIGLVVRHGLTVAAGAFGIEGLASGDTVNMATAVVSGLLGLGLSIAHKVKASKAAQ